MSVRQAVLAAALVLSVPPLSFAQQPLVVYQTINVDHGDYIAAGDGYGYCPRQGSYANEKALTGAVAGAIVAKLGLGGPIGALASSLLAQLFQNEIRSSGGSVKEFLETIGVVDSYAACGGVALRVPPGARLVAIQAWASDGASGWQMRPCFPPDGNGRNVCQVGWSEWSWSQNQNVIVGLFKNWSGDRMRQARLEVLYYPY